MEYTTNPGEYLIIDIVGYLDLFIAEVTQSSPLQMKVEEDGPLAHLKDGDYIIHEQDSALFQQDMTNSTAQFLEAQKNANRRVVSGLKSLGVPTGQLAVISV